MSVTKNDNSEQAASAIIDAVKGAMGEVGSRAQGHAKDICPVDTGNLRDSITAEVSEGTGEISAVVYTDVYYAPYVELGTSMQAAQPFLRPALTDHADEYESLVQSIVGAVLK